VNCNTTHYRATSISAVVGSHTTGLVLRMVFISSRLAMLAMLTSTTIGT